MSAGSSSIDERRGARELFNVITCLAYAVAGVLAALWRPGAGGYVFGAWMVALGVASAIYHWREWEISGARLDQAAMYGTFVALVVHAATRHPWAWPVMLAGGAAVGWRLGMEPDRRTMIAMVILQPVMILLGSLVDLLVFLDGTRWMALAALGLFGAAWWAWNRNWAYGHGTWHALTAAAILLLFLGVR